MGKPSLGLSLHWRGVSQMTFSEWFKKKNVYYVMVTDASKQREQEAGAFSVYIQQGWMSSIKFACKLCERAQQAAMKITEQLPGTLSNQLKLSCFPYSLLIMQMEPLKQAALSYHTYYKLRRPMWSTQTLPLHLKPCHRITGSHGYQWQDPPHLRVTGPGPIIWID